MSSNSVLRYRSLGGCVPKNAGYVYVDRQDELKLLDWMQNFENVVLHGPRQCGKTTIAMAVKKKLDGKGFATPWVNFQTDLSAYSKRDNWFKALFFKLGMALKIEPKIVEEWLKQREFYEFSALFSEFFNSLVSQKSQMNLKKIAVFFDEIDYTISLASFSDELFSGIRALANEPSNARNFQIAFTLIGVCQPENLLKNKEISFHIGHPLLVDDFEMDSQKVLSELVKGLPHPYDAACAIVIEISKWTSGHPYLTILLCDLFKRKGLKSCGDVDLLMDEFIKTKRNYTDENHHFENPKNHIMRYRGQARSTIHAYLDFLKGNEVESTNWENHRPILRMAGLIAFRNSVWVPRNKIYRQIYDELWCRLVENEIAAKHLQEGDYLLPLEYGSTKTKLIILNTGGTLGMEVNAEGKVLKYEDAVEGFKNNFSEVWDVLEKHCDIEFEELTCKDGANVFPEDWVHIARTIWLHRNNGTKRGVVVVHGTDTMAYTASAVAFALGPGLDFPVVFTGSQTTYNVPHGDAKINLLRACLVALEGSIHEVVICFSDKVFRACRADKRHDQEFEGFFSPSYHPLAIITERINVNHDLLLKKTARIGFELKASFAENILQIQQYPAFLPKIIDDALEKKMLNGIILKTLGVGNVPTLGKYNLLKFIRKAQERRIPVLITSQYPVDPAVRDRYLPAAAPIQEGAIPAGNMTGAAGVTKFMWVISQVEKMIKVGNLPPNMKLKEIERMMKVDYVGELDLST